MEHEVKQRTAAFGLGALAVAAVGLAYASFRSDIQAQTDRISGRSHLVLTEFGPIEFAVRGSGPPFLMIHGTGGGFDQALRFTEGLSGYQVIAPSRFGYLRSAFPPDPSSERQADAYAELLGHLHIEKLPVAGGSAGAFSAVQLALRHPERTSALILILPAANVRGRDPVEMSGLAEFMVRRMTMSDFLFRSATKIARKQMVGEGGHIWVGHERDLWREVASFAAENAPAESASNGAGQSR